MMKPYSIITMLTFALIGLTMLMAQSDSAKIVCVFPTASKSHVLGTQALLKELARRGHEVTMVSAFPLKKPLKNYRDVYVPIEESFTSIMSDFMRNVVFNAVENAMVLYVRHQALPFYEYNFPAEKGFRSYDEALRNVSLVLLNTHFTQTVPRPYLPNMVEVGGLQINPKPEPLPENLQQFLDGAGPDGAIFISFGSNLRSSNLRPDKLDAILSMIRKLKQRVVWTWDQDEMPNRPNNVFIGKWLPQDSMLAHPNLKLFITHGGLGSITEAMYYGVPIVGIPMYGDQEGNVAEVVRDGWGVSVNFDEMNESILTDAVQKVLADPKYREHIHTRAMLYKDRPAGALETAVFWVEYVIRHHGAPHLHYQGADLNILQSTLLDVYAFLGVALYVAYKLTVFIARKIKQVVLRGDKKTQGSKTQSKKQKQK